MFNVDRFNSVSKEAGKKKKYLADRMGVSASIFSDWANGKSSPRPEYLEILANELNTTPEYLMGESDQKEKATGIAADSYKAKLLQLAQDLDEEKAAKMLEMAKVMFGDAK